MGATAEGRIRGNYGRKTDAVKAIFFGREQALRMGRQDPRAETSRRDPHVVVEAGGTARVGDAARGEGARGLVEPSIRRCAECIN